MVVPVPVVEMHRRVYVRVQWYRLRGHCVATLYTIIFGIRHGADMVWVRTDFHFLKALDIHIYTVTHQNKIICGGLHVGAEYTAVEG